MFKNIKNLINGLYNKFEDKIMEDWNGEPNLKEKKKIAMAYCKEIMDKDPKFGVFEARSVYKDYVGEEAPF